MTQEYFLHVKAGKILGVTTTQTRKNPEKKFTTEDLQIAGILIPESFEGYHALSSPFVDFFYDENSETIYNTVKEGFVEESYAICAKAQKAINISEGFWVTFEDGTRHYSLSETSQLNILTAKAQADIFGSAEIFCKIGDKKEFLLHSREDCEKVIVAMYQKVLTSRKV